MSAPMASEESGTAVHTDGAADERPTEAGGVAPTGDAPRTDGARTSVASLEIRPISRSDREAFIEAFARLGERSRYTRFLTPHGPLSDAEIRYFTEVDHHDHEAMVAIDPASGQGVGVARYVRSKVDPGVAEVAVAVVDDWQRQGVGTRLGEALAARARSEGIRTFTALMLADNELMLNLLKELGEIRDVRTGSGTVELLVDLPDKGLGSGTRVLRALAAGRIAARRAAAGDSE